MNAIPRASEGERSIEQKQRQLEQAIVDLEARRELLGDLVVDSALEALRRQLQEIQKPSHDSIGLAGERKLVTIMFADVSGYTAMAEKLDPERARDLLNGYFEHSVPIVKKFGGTIDKFVGDEIVALFGAPVAHENDAERACAAALEMMAALADFNETHKTDLGLHFGINTGHVVAGDVGTREHHDYSVMGHAVNLAARLEDASSRGEIFVGPQTQRMTAAFFEFEEMTLEVQGASAPVLAYRLLRPRETVGRTRGLAGRDSPLVGREFELRVLQTLLDGLQKGRGSVVALIGEAGIGKSRLTTELHGRVRELNWYEGRCLSHTRGMSYWLARNLLRNSLGITATDTSAAGIEKLQKSLVRLIGETGLRFYPLLARFLELALDEPAEATIKELTPEALHRETIETVAAFIFALAVTQPLVLVCEDLHWADASSLQLLLKILPLTENAPILLLLVLRRDDEAANAFLQQAMKKVGDRFQRVELEPLSSSASERLLQNLLKVERLPSELAQVILNKTEGNPFFLEEVLRALIDDEVIRFSNGKATFRQEVQTVTVPDTVEGVLTSRVDRLPGEEKEVLQTAAVLGRVFDERLLRQLLRENQNRTGLHDCLEDLVSREFLRPHKAEADASLFIFKHALTHEVSYQSLLLTRRKDLHRRAAHAIEELWQENLDEQAAILGQHFAKAELAEKALEYLSRAGDRAAGSYANEEAIAFYRQALDQVRLAREKDEATSLAVSAPELHERAGDLLHLIGCEEQARASYVSALAEVEKLAEAERATVRRSKARLHRKIGKTHESQRGHEEALRQYDRAKATLGEERGFVSEDWAEQIETHLERIWVPYFGNTVEEMAREVNALRNVVELHGTSRQRGDFVHCQVLMRFRQERYAVSDETLALARKVFELREKDGDLLSLGHAHFVAGLAHVCRLELVQSEEELRAALKVAERTGDLTLLARCLNYLVLIERRRQDVGAAEHAVKRLLPVVMRGAMKAYIGMAKATLGWIAWREGDNVTAQAEEEAALDLWSTDSVSPFKWNALWPLMAIAAERKDVAVTAKYAQQLLDPAQQPLPPELAACVAEVIDACESAEDTKTLANVGRAVQLAGELKYL